jgi:acyl-CoA synthetase (AMP-forming)/AMP-acid ligase II
MKLEGLENRLLKSFLPVQVDRYLTNPPFTMPQQYGGEIGKRLFPVIIDEVARNDPDRAWASLPIDDYDLSQGFEDISYAAFANGINMLSHHIVAAFGRAKDFETIVYLGTSDIRYYMLAYAACKTGYKILFNSPMNALDFQLSLLDQTGCVGMLLARGVYVDDILDKRPIPNAQIPELDDLLNLSDLAPLFPYNKTFEEAEKDPFVIVQTSGATGPPHLVTYTNASFATMDIQTELPDFEGYEHFTWQCGIGTRYIMPASPFHAIAVVLAMTVSAFGGAVLVPGFRHRPMTGVNEVCDLIRHAGATEGFLTAFLADAIARRPDAEELIKRFDSLCYGNGMRSALSWLLFDVRNC